MLIIFSSEELMAENRMFSNQFAMGLIKLAIVDEMARADHWKNIDECLTAEPETVSTYIKYADAALRVVSQSKKYSA